LLLIVSLSESNAQSGINLCIERIHTTTDSLFVQFSLTNTGKQLVRLYKPERHDICYGIVRLIVKDIDNNEYQLMPCSEIIDIDAIVLNCKNSLYLSEGEKFIKTFDFSLKDATPFMPKEVDLNLLMEINLKDVFFDGKTDDLVKCNFTSIKDFKFKL